MLLPGIFFITTLVAFALSNEIRMDALFIYFLGFLLGSGTGFFYASRLHLLYDFEKNAVRLPGSWATFVLILLLFSTKYANGYLSAVQPEIAATGSCQAILQSITGICNGFLIGRFLGIWKQKRRADHVSLA